MNAFYRQRPLRWIIACSLLVCTAVPGLLFAQAFESHTLKTYTVEANTDKNGRFSVPHGIKQGCNPDCVHIYAMTAAFLSKVNQTWYGANFGPNSKFRFGWTDSEVNGIIEGNPDFADSKVRIVIFVRHKLG